MAYPFGISNNSSLKPNSDCEFSTSPPPPRNEGPRLTRSDSWESDFITGLVQGDLSDKKSAAKLVGQIAGGALPIVGQFADARDTAAAIDNVRQGKKGSWSDLGLSLLGWIPLVGDSLKTLGRSAKGTVRGREITEGIVTSQESLWNRMFYKPSISETPLLLAGQGSTDIYGNVVYSSLGTATDRVLVREHELVHSALSPKFALLRTMRAELGMATYNNSALFRYIEEALAESYAQVKVNGVNALPVGLKFPIENGYVEIRDVVTEGALGTVVVGGLTYGAYYKGRTDGSDEE